MRRICVFVWKIHKKWIFHTDIFDFNENDIRLINMEKALNILHIREKIPEDIFTSLELNALLEGYQNKGAKIASMLHRREIIPLRRGLYTFTAVLRKQPLSNGVMANRIYGPSYVSEDFALCYHGLIPETPYVVTSMTMGRSREFTNDFGAFSYRYCRSKAYSIGVMLAGGEHRHFLIASPFKALYDKALNDSRWDGEDPEPYLEDDLRIDLEALQREDKQTLHELAPFMTGRLKKLHHFLEEL